MRRLTLFLVLALSLPVPAAATANGDIVGVINNETSGKPQPGAKVTLLHLRQGEQQPETTDVVTDKNGRYRFEDLATGNENIYALDVRHQGGLFASGTITMPSDTDERPVVETELKVWDTTDDPNSILIRRNDAFLVPKDNSVAVVDSYRILNTTDLAYIGRGGAGATTTLGFPLPESARGSSVVIVNQPRIDIPDLRETEFGFGITVAIPPGRTDLTFSYSVEGTGGSYDLTRTALYPILDASVFAQDPLEVRSNRLEEQGPRTVGEDEYVEHSASEEIDAGDPLQVLAVAEAGMSPWLVVGAAVALGVIALALALGIFLRRRPRSQPRTASAESHSEETGRAASAGRQKQDRDTVVLAIAELDLRYRNGEIGEGEWRARREELKAGADQRAPEPTP